jgi:hypothetical protein
MTLTLTLIHPRVEQWQLAGSISRKSQVRFLPLELGG